MSKPTIILIPGAWHAPLPIYETIVTLLHEAKYPTLLVALPTVGSAASFADDVAAIRAAIIPLVEEQGKDVVVVMHSYGGVAGTEAMQGLGKKEREQRATPGARVGGVGRLVYVAAMVVTKGETAGEANARNQRVDLENGVAPREGSLVPGEVEGTLMVTDALDRFYNDVEPGRAREFEQGLKPHSMAAFQTALTYEAYKDIPSAYLITLRDNAIGWKSQEHAARDIMAAEMVETVEAGHSPFVSAPDVVANFIRRAAGESM